METKTFTQEQEAAIREKVIELKKVRDGTLTPEELAGILTERRLAWIGEHLEEMKRKYGGLPVELMAHRIVFLEHMKINPEHSRVVRVAEGVIRIDSYNFCPYLEACNELGLAYNELGLETRFVCKEIGEPSIQAMMLRIDPRLVFWRNYANIRPSHPDFCEEYMGLRRES
jgi:hypothetical protein